MVFLRERRRASLWPKIRDKRSPEAISGKAAEIISSALWKGF
jgi:hypothetical protein